MKKKFLILYSSNIAVKGYERSAIYSLNKGMIYLIPSTFYSVLKKLERTPFLEIQKKYKADKDIFDSYVEFLLIERLAFFTDTPTNFPAINKSYETAELIASANVEFAKLYKFESLIEQLDECNCKYLRIYLNLKFDSIYYVFRLLELASFSTLRSIELVINYSSSITEEMLTRMFSTYKKLNALIFTGCKKREIKLVSEHSIFFIPVKMSDLMKYYEVKNLLIVNHKFFFESHSYNPFFNKKVFIDKIGNIKNGLFTDVIFGNIKNKKLRDIVLTKDYQRLWKLIPKQLKNSEFRYCLYNPDNVIDTKTFNNCKIIERS